MPAAKPKETPIHKEWKRDYEAQLVKQETVEKHLERATCPLLKQILNHWLDSNRNFLNYLQGKIDETKPRQG